MVNSNWKVIAEYDDKKEYSVNITPKMVRTLQMFKLDDVFSPIDFVNKHKNDKKWLKIKNSKNAKNTLFLALNTAQKLGIVKRIYPKNQKTTFNEFIRIPEIDDFLKNISAMNLKNTKQTKYLGTRGRYAHTMWKFNDWLMKREFEYWNSWRYPCIWIV